MFVRLRNGDLVNTSQIIRIETLKVGTETGGILWMGGHAGTGSSIYIGSEDLSNIVQAIEKSAGLL